MDWLKYYEFNDTSDYEIVKPTKFNDNQDFQLKPQEVYLLNNLKPTQQMVNLVTRFTFNIVVVYIKSLDYYVLATKDIHTYTDRTLEDEMEIAYLLVDREVPFRPLEGYEVERKYKLQMTSLFRSMAYNWSMDYDRLENMKEY